MLIAMFFNARLFNHPGIEFNIFDDIVLTDVIASRGSNYIYDLVGKMTKPTISSDKDIASLYTYNRDELDHNQH